MNADAMESQESQAIAPAIERETRPLLWSVRRELWENRSIYLAPLFVAGISLFAFAFSTIGMPHRRRAVMALDEAAQRKAIGMPYDVVATILILLSFVVAFFYCLDALHGERRDRSLLFWKSLPVSDRTAVLSKAGIPLVVLPLLTFVIAFATHLLMLMLSNTVLFMSGIKAGSLFAQLRFIPSPVPMFYGILVMALWLAPVYAWLLLVSGWARRAVFLWAVLPFVTIAIIEKIAFSTSYFGKFLQYRIVGGIQQAFLFKSHVKGDPMEPLQMTPGKFLATPGLWLGLVCAAVFLALAVRMRRDRQPI